MEDERAVGFGARLERDRAAVVLHNFSDNCEPEPGAVRLPGADERIERRRSNRRRDTAALIRDARRRCSELQESPTATLTIPQRMKFQRDRLCHGEDWHESMNDGNTIPTEVFMPRLFALLLLPVRSLLLQCIRAAPLWSR